MDVLLVEDEALIGDVGGAAATAENFAALATIVHERRDGRWLIVHQHVSQPPR